MIEEKLVTEKTKYWDRIITEKLFSTAQLEGENQVGADPHSNTSIPFPRSILKSDKPTCLHQLMRKAGSLTHWHKRQNTDLKSNQWDLRKDLHLSDVTKAFYWRK